MPCELCQGGFWQCSDDDDPCAMGSQEKDTKEVYLQILTKKTGNKCKMWIQKSEGSVGTTPSGWTDAGFLKFTC